MPLSAISLARLGDLHPAVAARVSKMDALAPELNLQVTQGLRSWSDQAAIWDQGRDASGNIVDRSKVVTFARPGYSWHQFGLAIDLVPEDVTPGQPDWDATHPSWAKMIAVGESVGFYSGSHFAVVKGGKTIAEPDMPHFQLTGRFPSEPDDEVRQLFTGGGVKAVWDEAQVS